MGVGGLRLAPSCQAFLQIFSPKSCYFVQIFAIMSRSLHFEHKFAQNSCTLGAKCYIIILRKEKKDKKSRYLLSSLTFLPKNYKKYL